MRSNYKKYSPKALDDLIDNYNSILSMVPCHIYWKDKNGKYLGCNLLQAKNLGFSSPDEMIGKTDFELPWFKEAAALQKADQQVMKTKKDLTFEEEVVLPNSQKAIFLSKKAPLLTSSGNIKGIIGISFDITERKKIEAELKIAKEAAESASRAKTEFIANMSHDIRNPLTGVIGMSEILENSLENPEQKENAHMLHDSGEKLLNMLNDILDDIRAEHMHETDIHEEDFDLYQFIQELVQLELPTIKLKKLELIIDIGSNVPQYIRRDRKKIHRILLNLLGNAIKFTKSGHITIEVKCKKTTKSSTQIQFSVADTGIGIPKEFQAHVFDRFSRAIPSYKGLYEGHGLGLHIAYSYVSLLGGHISVASKENVGTTFHFDLKCKVSKQKNDALKITLSTEKKSLVNSEAKAPAPIYKSQNSSKDLSLPHLLLVDDSPIALKVLESIASSTGFQFTSADNGEDALRLLKSMHFDLVITDIGLPDFSGIELTRRIRDFEKTIDKDPVPIIGLSGHETKNLECIASGMNNIFIKPIPSATLQKVIHQFLPKIALKQLKSINLDDTIHPKASGKLGLDLLDTEDELFKLDSFLIFDPNDALQYIGLATLIDLLRVFISDKMQNDIHQIELDYIKKDWDHISNLAHKISGGAAILGLKRMRFAAQYLERYDKTKYSDFLDKLYYQFLTVNCDTIIAIKKWLEIYG